MSPDLIGSVDRSGQRVENHQIRLKIVPSKTDQTWKWFVRMTKNTAKLAWERNRSKRLVSQALSNLNDKLTGGGKGVVIIKQTLAKTTEPQLRANIYQLLVKSGQSTRLNKQP